MEDNFCSSRIAPVDDRQEEVVDEVPIGEAKKHVGELARSQIEIGEKQFWFNKNPGGK